MKIPNIQQNIFIPGVSERGYKTTYFFPHVCCEGSEFQFLPKTNINGYASYSFITTNSSIVGIAVFSIRSKTTMNHFLLKIGVDRQNIPTKFDAQFFLEKLGLLMYIAKNSSVLFIPVNVNSSLLVKIQ